MGCWLQAHDDDLAAKQLLIADLNYQTPATGYAAVTAFWKARVYVTKPLQPAALVARC